MKSPTKSPDDGPEEGEIVSDELEDISDESIVFNSSFGKSVSRSDHSHALSLSSVTDLEMNEPPTDKRRKRRKSYSARRQKKRKTSLDSDSSDNDDISVNNRLKHQLKAAVRVDTKEAHRNSLRTRLKAMVKGGGAPESDNIVESKLNESSVAIINLVEQEASSCIEIVASSSENGASAPESATEQLKTDEIDNELIQLRIEALKTAFNNKFANRKKKRKDNLTSDDTNKENTNSEENQGKNTPLIITENKLEPLERPLEVNPEIENNIPTSPEEDEDVLRALLLASMSKKITKTYPESPPQKVAIINRTNNSNFHLNNNNAKKVLNNVRKYSVATKLIKVPQVKPLIINVNSDSDSDWEFSSSSPEKPSTKALETKPGHIKSAINLETILTNSINSNVIKKVENGIETTVEQFLKEQRAKVESEKLDIKPQIITQKKPEVKELEKSALKFLPANKREEYKKLQNLLRIKKAQLKKPKVRKISQKITDNNRNDAKAKEQNIVKKMVHSRATQTVSVHVQLSPQAEARIAEFRREEERAAKRERTKKNECLIMRATLKQLQTKNGRLQIQEKYKSLRPLVKKLNEVSKEQKQCDETIQRLTAELEKAREKQETLHRNMSASVKELADEKKKIDLSVSKAKASTLITSTPIKPSNSSTSTSTTTSLSFTNSSTKNSFCSDPNDIDLSETSNIMMNTWEQSTICANKDDVLDPNDIDGFIEKTMEHRASLEENILSKKPDKVKYVSPLDASQRKDLLDPFGIMCPFEVNGTCKDPDCSFNHLPK